MVREEECPPEEFGGGPPGPPPEVIVVPRPAAPPLPAAPGIFPGLGALVDLIRDIFGFIRGGTPVYIKAATRSEIQQYPLSDATKFSRVTTIPADALSWELWNSNLGSATGILDWAYITDPGTAGSGRFNELAVNERATRALAGVDIYVKPASVNQVVVLEILRP